MKWWDDNSWRLSAALSYTLFSLAPLFTIAVATVGADKSTVQDYLLRHCDDLIGQPGATAITKMLQSFGHTFHGTVATLISLITLFVVSPWTYIANFRIPCILFGESLCFFNGPV